MARRWYLDSVDRVMTVRSMEEPLEVLHFMKEHSDSDIRTHETALRKLGYLATHANYDSIVGDGRFHGILASLASSLEDCDARRLSGIADACGRFRRSTPELGDLAQRLAEAVIRREDAFNTRSLATIALSLSLRGTRDVSTVEFIRTEALKLMNEFEPAHCTMLLEAFRRWGVFDRQLVDLIVERMSDEVDRFTARDVVEAVAVVSRLGLARGFLLRRLCTLAFENLGQFGPRDLAMMAYSLAKLRFLARRNVDDLVDAVRPELYQLRGSPVSELLFALAMTDAKHQGDVARALVAKFIDDSRDGVTRSLGSLVDFSWALASLELVGEFEQDFKDVIAQIVQQQPPQNRVPLMKLFDVFCALELEHKALRVEVPAVWKNACDEADRFEMEKLESSRLHNEVVMRFDQLRGTASGTRWQLRMQRNQQCGPYRVDMLDEDTRVALDLEIISWPTARHMKHRLLKGLGYRPVRLEYWDWRRTRSEEDQNTFLEREVCRALDE